MLASSSSNRGRALSLSSYAPWIVVRTSVFLPAPARHFEGSPRAPPLTCHSAVRREDTRSIGATCSVGRVRIINNGFDVDRASNTWGMPSRGEVWWVFGTEPSPVVVLSSRDELEVRAIYVVPAAETDISGVAIELPVGREEGLPSGVVRVALARQDRINCSWLVSLKESDLNEQAGALSEEKLSILADMLRLGGLE